MSATRPKLGAPPPGHLLRASAPALLELPKGTRLWRVYARGGDHPVTWKTFRHHGPLQGRFDHHDPPARHQDDRGVLYAGSSGPVSLAEAFQAQRRVDRHRAEPWLCAFDLRAPVVLGDLTGTWATRMGGSQAIASGPRPRAQAWARALHAADLGIAGVAYRSSMHGGEPAYALWESAAGSLPGRATLDLPLSDPTLLVSLLRAAGEVGYRIS